MTRTRMLCATCRSDNVTRDAWARWDTVTQSWTLAGVFDDAFCHACEREAGLVAVAPAEPASSSVPVAPAS